MSPSGPYQGEPGRQPYGRPPAYPPQQQYGGYQEPGYREPYQQQDPYRQPPQRPAAGPPPSYDDERGGGFRIPGIGLVLTVLGLVVQVLCLLILPWVSASAAGGEPISLPELWDAVTDAGASGFGGWYVVLFTYPLAALGVLLALVSVLESVAMKFVWAGLAIVGVGYLVLRYGLLEMFGEGGVDLSRQELTTVVVAVAVLVLVIFMLRTAMVWFRRIAGIVLLVIAGVHIYAVQDFAPESESLSIGAYGPALGYVISGVAAIIGPRRLIPG
ncbi:hypothetical protein BLA60_06985 [Actinophytocola xinjiangensis]|uniref:Uncharacterized protein n=1 Tax=Actinophytocola xinjiangensis TaxID=485602 RepID=A0A7Z0WR79_9PSEU|nr:hypothetical protein [Actinophytocola xinjiangensis]OLF12985.1 hypothetical protein BLA60_06985 [Actinophytocola xinjiangensis]